MAAIDSLTAFKAIQNEIRSLCLQEFPCGTGSWRDTCDLPKANQKGQLKHKSLDKKSDCSRLEAHAPEKVKSEDLLDLITSLPSPWYQDYDWSNDAKGLREIAVKSPWIINPDFVYSFFRTLKIVDKSVTEVDEGLLHLKNLEELTLSANYITNIDSRCLPPSLKVLELYANNIQDISDLCNTPLPLHHLGLGRNNISFVGEYISGDYWPNLASLELSHNNLCDLTGIVSTLCSLPKLRNLNLQGNPVSLLPAYRGYIIDCLQDLLILDDRHISADERYHSQDFARKRELIQDEAVVQIAVSYIKGLPCPAEIMAPDELSEFPIINRTYFVQFMFPEKLCVAPEEMEKQNVDNLADKIPENVDTPQTAEKENELNRAAVRSHHSITDHEQTSLEKNLASTDDPQKKNDIITSESKDVKSEDSEVPDLRNLVPVNSPQFSWEEEIHLNWTTDLILSDLLAVRDFFRAGMDVNVVEQIVESNPVVAEGSKEKSDDVKGKDKKKDKESDKAKVKQKKLLDEELVKSPPYFNNVVSFHASLDCFLDGEHSYEETFTIALNKSPVDKPKVKKKSSKPLQDKKKGAKDKDPEKTTSKGEHNTVEEDEETAPLSLNLTVKLQHWLMALDAHTEKKQSPWSTKIEAVLH